MRGAKILVTGPTGQVALPITKALAADNEVWGAARFRDAASREALEKAGVHCVALDLLSGDLSALPTDFDYVLNLAVVRSGRWSKDLAGNGEAAGLLMAHCKTAKAFLHCSSAAVYAGGAEANTEDAALGDNHRHLFPTYSIAKIATEVVVRTMARHLGLPSVIARLSVPYGDNGGWPAYHLEAIRAGEAIPVIPGGRELSLFNPIHEDDIIATIPKLLEVAAVPATTVNWGGSQTVGLHEWCEYMGELVDLPVRFAETDDFTILGTRLDVTHMHELIGETTVDWRDGIRRLVNARS